MRDTQVDTNSTDAMNHPVIKKFITLVEETTKDGILDYTDLQTRPFMKFWLYFMILRQEADANDFRFILYGTDVANAYGKDCTGLLLSEMGYGNDESRIYEEHLRTVETSCRIYGNGNVIWQSRDHIEYHLVRVPLRRNGKINESLTCVIHS